MKRLTTKGIIRALFIIMLVTFAVVSTVVWKKPVLRATMEMGWGAIVVWIIISGGIMYRFRDRIAIQIQKLPWPEFWKFFIFALLLFMIEEAVMTTMTNLAPLFGVPLGSAFITASPNYFWTLVSSSLPPVGLLILLFAWIFVRFRLTATKMFFAFGLAGWCLEVINMPANNILNAPYDIFVYGLMVWLPAYAIWQQRNRDKTAS